MDVRGVIFDLDGTVYRGDELVAGARRAVESVRDRGCSVLFFSNNPTHDGAAYVERLRRLGIDARPGEACSSATVTREYLDAEHGGDGIFVVGSEPLREQVRRTAARLVEEPSETDVLLASWTDTFGYDDMVDALRAVDDGTAFLGTDPDITFPNGDGDPVPGSGAVVESLAAVLEREPDRVLGKPSEVALDAALDRLGCPPEQCLVVGDRLETDIAMGARAGMRTALVTTGTSTEADVATSEITPDHVLDSIADLPALLDAA